MLDFNGFRFRSFASHQVLALISLSIICVSSNDGCSLLMTKQVSYAKNLGRQLLESCESFINNKNNKDPKNDPLTAL